MLHYFSSLRLRAEIASVVVVLGMSIAVTFSASRLVLDGGKTQAESSIKQTAELLNLAASPYTTMGGLPVLQDFLNGMIGETPDASKNGLIYMVIVSDTNEILVSAGKVPAPLPPGYADIRSAVTSGIVHVRNPILLRGNSVGALQFGMSTRAVLETQRSIQDEILKISGSMAVLVLGLVFVAGLRVSRRIERLIAATKTIAGGNYHHIRADDSGMDELSQLASNFNAMANAVSAQITEVQKARTEVEMLNQSLEATVTVRTGELEQKNAELASTIDNLHQTRESLVRSEKLAGLGSIVAGVAHELNTPIGNALTVSSTQVENTRTFIKDIEAGIKRSTLLQFVENSRVSADLIERNLVRAAQLVQGFKQVAVDQTSDQKRTFKLKETIDEHLLMLQPMLKQTPYRIVADVAPEISMNSYPGPLGQVVTNLVNNAVLHGFNGRDFGTVKLESKKINENWLRLTVSDDGVGISAENQDRIFDPFFTTRLGQGGSGLGLNIVFNIVHNVLGGTIEVRSNPGEGSVFVVILPIAAPTTGEVRP